MTSTSTETTPAPELAPARVFALLHAEGLEMTTDPAYPATAFYVDRDGFSVTRVIVTGHNPRRQAQGLRHAAQQLNAAGYTTVPTDPDTLAVTGYSNPEHRSTSDAFVTSAAAAARVLGVSAEEAFDLCHKALATDRARLVLRIRAEVDRAKLNRFGR